MAAYQTARISPWAKTSKSRPRVAVTAGKGALGDTRPLGRRRQKNAPRWILLGGGDTSAGRSLDIKGEKLSRRAQNSTGVQQAIFTFIFTVNKYDFMALGPSAPFSYIFRRKRIIWSSLLFA